MMAMIILLPLIMATSDAMKLLIWKLRCQSMYAPDWKSRQMYDSDMTFLGFLNLKIYVKKIKELKPRCKNLLFNINFKV